MPAPAARTAKDAIITLLGTTTLAVFDGDQIDQDGPPKNANGYVSPHAVVWAGAGQVTLDNLAAVVDGRGFEFQVTAVGANSAGCLTAADKVLSALAGARLNLSDGTSGVIHQTADSGPQRVDTNVDPHRTYLPLVFGVRLASN